MRLMFDFNRVSDIDMKTREFERLHSLELHGDNLEKFISSWDTMIDEMSQVYDDAFLNTLFAKQINKSKHCLIYYGITSTSARPTKHSALSQRFEAWWMFI